jgi:hypothetical protein
MGEEATEAAAQALIAAFSWADPSDNNVAWRASRCVVPAALSFAAVEGPEGGRMSRELDEPAPKEDRDG